MNFKETVLFYLQEKKDPERKAGGYKAMATRLTNDLGRKISPKQVKKYLASMESKSKSIKKRSKKARKPGAYEWATKYHIMLGHFRKV